MIWFSRTKDNTFVYCALKKVLAKVLPMALEMGVPITQVVHMICVRDHIEGKYRRIIFTDGSSIIPILEQWNGACPQRARKDI